MKNILLIGLYCGLAQTVFAQTKVTIVTPKIDSSVTPKTTEPVGKKGYIYNKEYTVEAAVRTNGWSVGFNWGTLQTYYKTTYWHASIGEITDPREHSVNANVPSDRIQTYVFGKQNSFFQLRGGWGAKRYFSEKAKEKGVALGINYSYGVSLGILKPYYLDLYETNTQGNYNIVSTRYSKETADRFLDGSLVYGASSFFNGFDNVTFVPGAYGRVGVHLDWGAYDAFAKAIEVGVAIDAYPQKVPIMAPTLIYTPADNRAIFIGFYAALIFGKRE